MTGETPPAAAEPGTMIGELARLGVRNGEILVWRLPPDAGPSQQLMVMLQAILRAHGLDEVTVLLTKNAQPEFSTLDEKQMANAGWHHVDRILHVVGAALHAVPADSTAIRELDAAHARWTRGEP